MSSQNDERPILGSVFNQIQALRDGLVWALAGEALDGHSGSDWIRGQDLNPSSAALAEKGNVSAISLAVTEYLFQELGQFVFSLTCGLTSSCVNPNAKELGQARAGAGWDQAANFCITSALVRLLGAWEQFELDVLKALLHYRPHGDPLGPQDEHDDIVAEVDVLNEEPEQKKGVEYYKKPALWTWIKPRAIDNIQRRQIFKRVFGLDLSDGTAANNKRSDLYEDRNKIAHGRAGVKMSLKEHLDAEILVVNSVYRLEELCRTKMRVII